MITGTLDLPSITNVELGVVFDDNTKTGVLDLPSINDVISGVVFGSNSYTGVFVWPLESAVVSGTLYGASGLEYVGSYIDTGSGDYPAISDVRNGVLFNYNTQSGILELPDVSNVLYNIIYGANNEYTGVLVLPGVADVRNSVLYGAYGTEYLGTYTATTVAGAQNLITSAFKQLYIDSINILLQDNALTVPCRLLYGDTKWNPCSNCIFDAASGKSSGRYKTGGPIQFTKGACPNCHGLGKLPITSEEVLYLAAIFDSKDWIKWNKDSISPHSAHMFVQTISKFAESYVKLKKSKYIIIDTNIEDHTTSKYERFGEPEPVGLGASTYVITMWRRI